MKRLAVSLWVCLCCTGCAEPVRKAVYLPDYTVLEPGLRLAFGPGGEADTGVVPDALILWGELDEELRLELVQGASRGTAEPWGHLDWARPGGDLHLRGWSLMDDSGVQHDGRGDLRLADASAADGDRAVRAGYDCRTTLGPVDALWGRFDNGLTVSCTGPDRAPVGRWRFARDVGLVGVDVEVGGGSVSLSLLGFGR